MEKLIELYKLVDEKVNSNPSPIQILILITLFFMLGFGLGFLVLMGYNKLYGDGMNTLISIHKNEKDELIKSRNNLRDSLVHYYDTQSLMQLRGHIKELNDLESKNFIEKNQLVNEKFIEKMDYILETANQTRLLPDTVTSYFNTLEMDRPLLQISNYSRFPNSNLDYNYEAQASPNDSLTLFLWLHNTSYNEAVNPIINLTVKKNKRELNKFHCTTLRN